MKEGAGLCVLDGFESIEACRAAAPRSLELDIGRRIPLGNVLATSATDSVLEVIIGSATKRPPNVEVEEALKGPPDASLDVLATLDRLAVRSMTGKSCPGRTNDANPVPAFFAATDRGKPLLSSSVHHSARRLRSAKRFVVALTSLIASSAMRACRTRRISCRLYGCSRS